MDNLQVHVGVAVALVKNNKILLGQRKGKHAAGKWGCPGGHVEFYEAITDCAIRETLEETGIQPKIIDAHVLGWNEAKWVESEKHAISIYVLATCDDKDEPLLMEPTKCEEWRWFDKEELNDIPLMESVRMKGILCKAIEYYHSEYLML